jgi:hypothetical protein
VLATVKATARGAPGNSRDEEAASLEKETDSKGAGQMTWVTRPDPLGRPAPYEDEVATTIHVRAGRPAAAAL